MTILALALAAGGLAASQVRSSIEEVESRVGAPTPVVVARQDIPGGTRLEPQMLERVLSVQEIPERFVPPDSLGAPAEAAGLRVAVPLAAGSYVTVGHLETGVARGGPAGPELAPGERVVEVPVAAGAIGAAPPGTRVDVLVTTSPESGGGRTYVALQKVELLDARSGAGNVGAAGAEPATGVTAALRVTLEQAVMLTAAQNFAQEIRLLVRSPADRRRIGPTSIRAADL
ncbi:MAG: Flp pilus assembly protein CpaB [Thermoleophilaceae bacterium]|nr:Flp pilus assembly protein CpaB [Thermoleophilaceae bacterium]